MMADLAAMKWLHLHIGSQQQLLDFMDTARFRQRDLDPVMAADFREGSEQLCRDAWLGIKVALAGETATSAESNLLCVALYENFARSAANNRRRLRRPFRDSWISFLATVITVAEWAATRVPNPRHALLVENAWLSVAGGRSGPRPDSTIVSPVPM